MDPTAAVVPLRRGWTLWSTAVLRSAGFPAEWAQRLSAPDLAAAVDRWSEHRERQAAARAAAIEACRTQLERTPKQERDALQRLLAALRRDAPPRSDAASELLAVELAALAEATAEVERARAEAAAIATPELSRISRELRRFGADPLFREALVWQNRRALHLGVDRLLQRPEGASDAKTRGHEALITSYVQRYALKNESVGFFGPIAWARLDGLQAGLHLRHGPRLVAETKVFFEYWAISALAERLALQPSLRSELHPRRLPSIHLDQHGARLADRPLELDPASLRLLQLAGGTLPAHALAARTAADPELDVEPEEALELLEALAEAGLVSWTLELPTSGAHPERALREALERIAGAEARAAGLEALDRLETGRRAVEVALGDPAALDRALGALEETFSALTGQASTRAEGQTYAGRTLLFCDARRDVEVVFGPDLAARLAEPLSLVLQSARWFSFELARRYRTAIEAVLQELAPGGEPLELATVWKRIRPLFPGPGADHSILRQVRGELQSAWAELLGIDPGLSRIERSAAELEAAVLSRFAAERPGWPQARHHSPDLMIAASSAEAFSRGEGLIVLGEIHTGFNTVTSPFMLELHPDPREVIAQRERELPEPGLAPVWTKNRSRADFFSLSSHDFDLENGPARSRRPRSQVLAWSELVVCRRGDAITVATRDGRRSFDLIAALEQHLIAESHGSFSLLAKGAHTPRVTLDGLVLSRESWRVPAGELAFARLDDRLERFAGARIWARSLGLPERLFVGVPEEPKPTFLDLSSPAFVEAFCKLVRACTSSVTLVEMLPGQDQLWLTGPEGRAYTSELRVAARDPRAFAPVTT